MTRLLLIRHGQSEWNADGRWQGQANPPLTTLGRRQAAEASASLGAVDGIFSSTLNRAHSTAEIIAAEIGIGPVIALPGLIERHAGEWQGLTRSQIEAQFPGYLDENRRPPSWESDDSLAERAFDSLDRIVRALAELGARGEERSGVDVEAIVVTHGGLVYEVERRLGATFERMGNLDGRYVNHVSGSWVLGERVDLLHGVDVTIPDQI
ncbi:MAG TPA: histidine phosphatase family protein [Microthrixaceae bacterium]|nr:histidine phosphatase family protein [Microthrixaceae bacterium]